MSAAARVSAVVLLNAVLDGIDSGSQIASNTSGPPDSSTRATRVHTAGQTGKSVTPTPGNTTEPASGND